MRFVLDSIAENQRGERIATFECGEKMISINENDMPNGFIDTLISSAIVEAELIDGKMVNPVILEKETKDKKAEMRSILNRLRNRNKK
ncbi:MAG: hypothetical protein IJ400_01235 [Clostridia bacterium]|nr:hypothetical protein [Clostridia bacterium]